MRVHGAVLAVLTNLRVFKYMKKKKMEYIILLNPRNLYMIIGRFFPEPRAGNTLKKKFKKNKTVPVIRYISIFFKK